jgi:hypothetical protein
LPFFEVFDQPSTQTSCPRREQSTHVPQALELLNGELSNRLAGAWAQRLQRELGEDAPGQVDRAFLLATGRLPNEQEQRLATEFLRENSLRELALAIFNLNAFLYVE